DGKRPRLRRPEEADRTDRRRSGPTLFDPCCSLAWTFRRIDGRAVVQLGTGCGRRPRTDSGGGNAFGRQLSAICRDRMVRRAVIASTAVMMSSAATMRKTEVQLPVTCFMYAAAGPPRIEPTPCAIYRNP